LDDWKKLLAASKQENEELRKYLEECRASRISEQKESEEREARSMSSTPVDGASAVRDRSIIELLDDWKKLLAASKQENEELRKYLEECRASRISEQTESEEQEAQAMLTRLTSNTTTTDPAASSSSEAPRVPINKKGKPCGY
jgi:hypothetical protein